MTKRKRHTSVTVKSHVYLQQNPEQGGKEGKRARGEEQSVLDQALQDSCFTTQFLIYLFTIFLYRIHSAVISMHQQSWMPLLEGRRGGNKNEIKTKALKKKKITNKGVKRNPFSI